MRVPGQFTGEIRDSLRDLMWKEAGIVVSAVCDTPTRLPTMVSPLDRKSYAFVYVCTLSRSRSCFWERAYVFECTFCFLPTRATYRVICMRIIIHSDMHMVARGKTLYACVELWIAPLHPCGLAILHVGLCTFINCGMFCSRKYCCGNRVFLRRKIRIYF